VVPRKKLYIFIYLLFRPYAYLKAWGKNGAFLLLFPPQKQCQQDKDLRESPADLRSAPSFAKEGKEK